MRTLFVVLGAGASFDSTSAEYVPETARIPSPEPTDPLSSEVPGASLRPPLVTQLFDPRFNPILERYPLAQMAASDVRSRSTEPVAIERFLRDRYRDSEHPLDRRKFHAIHFYFQDLLWTVSKQYTQHPDNYDRLITATERLPSVVYVTLNYDTLLDDRLRVAASGSLFTLENYVSPDRNWSLVKLHGSVDWAVPISQSQEWIYGGKQLVYEPPADVPIDTGNIVLRPTNAHSIEQLRLERQGSQFFYPALSVPLGSPDEFACPEGHVSRLRDALRAQDQLDVLMLGYSGLDTEVLRLLADVSRPLGWVTAVGKDRADAQQTLDRLRDAVRTPVVGGMHAADETFSEFVTGDGLRNYIGSRLDV